MLFILCFISEGKYIRRNILEIVSRVCLILPKASRLIRHYFAQQAFTTCPAAETKRIGLVPVVSSVLSINKMCITNKSN